MNRVPPYDKEAEVAVLGGILLSNNAFFSVKGIISGDSFYNEVHRRIFLAMDALATRLVPIDFVTLRVELKRMGDWEKVGGIEALAGLTDAVATAQNIVHYAKIVKEKSAVRHVIGTAQEIVAKGYGGYGDPVEYLSESMASIVSAASVNTGSDPIAASDGLSAITKTALEGKQSVARRKTGIQMLDHRIGGLPKGVVTLIGARPSMGKTSIALIIAMHVASNEPVLYFTLEDSIASLQARVLSNLSGIPYFDIDRGCVPLERGPDLMLAQAEASKLRLFLEERRSTVEEIAQKSIAFMATQGKCGLIVVDHLGYIADSVHHQRKTSYDVVSDKTRSLAYVAKELGCAVILNCQLNRSLENRPDKRPLLSDFRDSGKIEEDARLAIMLYRDVMYNKEADERVLEMIIRKHTGGPGGTVAVDFDKACCRCRTLTGRSY